MSAAGPPQGARPLGGAARSAVRGDDTSAPSADEGLDLRRVEEVSLNALQTQRQLFYDGWLLRVSPGKARRGRSVNAHFGSTLPLAQKIRHCERIYEQRHLPVLFRMTPFVQPPGLPEALAAEGYEAFDPTLVQVVPLDRPPEPRMAAPRRHRAAAGRRVRGRARGPAGVDARAARRVFRAHGRDPAADARAGRARRRASRSPRAPRCSTTAWRACSRWRPPPTQRGRGIASALLAGLLTWAWERGAAHAYLQVDAANAPALAVYRKFGFATAYTYHYCGRPGERE